MTAAATRETDQATERRDGFAVRMAARVALVAFVAFALVLENEFVAWDDQDNFLANNEFRGFGWPQIRWAWTTMRLGVYQPIAWMLLELQYLASGMNPRGYHLASLFMHTANAVVLYGLTFTLIGRCKPDRRPEDRGIRHVMSGLAAALFAVHPLRAEVVAWASCQPYLPCTLFSMLSVLAYLHDHEDGRPSRSRLGWTIGSFLLMAAAMLSKAAALTLPLVLVILDVYPLRRLGGGPGRWWNRPARRVWVEKLPFLALCPVIVAAALVSKREDANLVPVGEVGIMARLAQSCYAGIYYPIKTILPFNLNPYQMRPQPMIWSEPRFLLAFVAMLAVSVVLFRLRSRHPAWLAAWTAYLVLLLPTSGLVTYGMQLVADRYSYLATIPAFILGAAGLRRQAEADARGRAVERWTVGVGVMGLVGLIVLSWDQSCAWRDSVTLWEHSVTHGAAEVADLHNNIGSAWAAAGEFDLAIVALDHALTLRPDYPEAHLNLSRALVRLGRLDEAAAHGAELVRLQPDRAASHVFLGRVEARRGKHATAAAEFAEALRLQPNLDAARKDLDAARRAQRPGDAARAGTRSGRAGS